MNDDLAPAVDGAGRRSPAYVAVIALAAALILVAGWLLRPRDIPESPPPVPSESELQELARRAQRRSLESTAAYFGDLAAAVGPSLGYIPALGMSAVVWDDSRVVTGTIAAAPRPDLILRTAADSRRVDAESSRRLPLSVVEVSLPLPARPAPRAAALPGPGDWVVAVWQTDEAPAFAAGNFGQIAGTACGSVPANELTASIPLMPSMIGGALFNMDRELLAVILPCADRIAAVALPGIDDMLARLAAVEERCSRSTGFCSPALRRKYGRSSVVGGGR